MGRLFVGLTLSSLGDGMSGVAIVWLAIQISHPENQAITVALAAASFSLPGVIAGLTLGKYFGHRDSQLLLAVDCVIRTVTLCSIPVLSAFGVLSPTVYVGILFLSSLMHAWGLAGRYALVAELLPKNQRLAGNSLLTVIDSVALILGPAIAGAVILISSASIVIGIDGISYGILAITLLRTRRLVRNSDARVVPSRGSARGMRMLLRTPPLVALLALSFMFNFLFGPVEVALPLYIAHDLHRGVGTLGAFWTVFGVGAVIGGLLIGMLRGVRILPAILAIVFGWAAALLPLGLSQNMALSLACFALGGLIYAPYPALVKTLMQENSPPGVLAAVGAAWSSLIIMSQPLGTALGGPLVAATSPQMTILISALATAALGVSGLGIFMWWRWFGRRRSFAQ